MDHRNGSGSIKAKTICEKLSIIIKTTSPFQTIRFGSSQHREDRCARVSKQSGKVQVILDKKTNHSNQKNYGGVQEKVAVLVPIHGQENRVPTMIEHGQVISGAGNINGMFSDFIDRTKNRFLTTMPSTVGVPKTISIKEERRLK